MVIAGLLTLGLFNLYHKNHLLTLSCWSAVFLVTGLSWYIFYDQKSKVDLPFDESVVIEGMIIKPPEIDYQKQKIIIETKNLSANNSRILVNAPRYPAFNYGDQVKIEGKLEKPGKIEQFDYGAYLKRYLVFGLIYQPTKVEEIGQNESILTRNIRLIYSVPSALIDSINRTLPEPQASLSAGLLFGVKRNIPDDFKDALAKTGLTHIIALSGYNVTIIIVALAAIMAQYFGRKRTFWLGVAVVIFFVIMTGAASSVLRAAIFSTLILFGRLIGRRGDQTNLMLLAAFLMILFNPYISRYDIGFQLSFAAFAGLIYLSPIIESLISKSRATYLPIYIKSPFTETMSAQIMVFPLIIIYFGRLSIIAPIANVAVLWIVPLAMLVSLIAGIGGLIWWWLGWILSWLAWPVLTYIIVITEWLARVPLASIELKNFNWILALVLYTAILFLTLFFSRKFKINRLKKLTT